MAVSRWTEYVLEAFKAYQVEVLAYVPDSVLADIIRRAHADIYFTAVPLAREEEGIGVVTGAYLGGKRGALLMQVSGLGNCINALASLAVPYQIPIPMLISQRGELGEFNAAQIPMGMAARPILESLGLQHVTLDSLERVPLLLEGALKTCFTRNQPCGIILSNELVGWKAEK